MPKISVETKWEAVLRKWTELRTLMDSLLKKLLGPKSGE